MKKFTKKLSFEFEIPDNVDEAEIWEEFREMSDLLSNGPGHFYPEYSEIEVPYIIWEDK